MSMTDKSNDYATGERAEHEPVAPQSETLELGGKDFTFDFGIEHYERGDCLVTCYQGEIAGHTADGIEDEAPRAIMAFHGDYANDATEEMSEWWQDTFLRSTDDRLDADPEGMLSELHTEYAHIVELGAGDYYIGLVRATVRAMSESIQALDAATATLRSLTNKRVDAADATVYAYDALDAYQAGDPKAFDIDGTDV